MTRNGVEYNSYNTPYQIEIDRIIYKFSSASMIERFKRKYEEACKEIEQWGLNKIGVRIAGGHYAGIRAYRQTEFRFFHIVYEGVVITCPKNLILSGLKINKTYLQMQSDNSTLPSLEQQNDIL